MKTADERAAMQRRNRELLVVVARILEPAKRAASIAIARATVSAEIKGRA